MWAEASQPQHAHSFCIVSQEAQDLPGMMNDVQSSPQEQSIGASWRATPLFDGQDNNSGEDASSASPALPTKTAAHDATNNQSLQQQTSKDEVSKLLCS